MFVVCVVINFERGSHSTNNTSEQQGGEVMDYSVKKWWPKVAAAAGAADTEQAILDLEGV